MGPGHPQREREGASPGRGEPGNHLLSSGGQIAKPNVSVFEHFRQSSIKVAHSENELYARQAAVRCSLSPLPPPAAACRAAEAEQRRAVAGHRRARGAPTPKGPTTAHCAPRP